MLDLFAKKEAPIQGMMGLGGGVPSRLLTLASGEITYVDDVFSTFLWEGDGGYNLSPAAATVTVDNGIDLSGEGGLVWLKNRDDSYKHWLFDTERGGQYALSSNASSAQQDGAATNRDLTFNSTGFVIGEDDSGGGLNRRGEDHASWTFRKCRGFFDVVTYTSQSGVTAINHNLGSVPGCIMVKKLNGSASWQVYHRSSGAGKEFELDGTDRERTNGAFPSTPTSTQFFINAANNNVFGTVGDQFVAYLFAHNDGSFGEDSDEAVIKCDSYTGTQSEDTEINVGFEPQWILIKNASSNSTDWVVVDTMRGLPVGSDSEVLKANSSGTPSSYRAAALTPTGFKLGQGVTSVNRSGDTYIYMAIRRPHKPPEAGTEVFKPFSLSAGEGQDTFISTGFDVDTFIYAKKGNGLFIFGDRLRGKKGGGDLRSDNNSVEDTNTGSFFLDQSRGAKVDYSGGHNYSAPAATDESYVRYFLRRAPGFFDVVTYSGSNSAQNISHNLGSKPALIICKRRNSTGNWQVYADVPAGGATKYMMLDDTGIFNTNSNRWNNTEPTATQFTVGTYSDLNTSGGTYIAYLFGNLDGICKIGQYTGTGNDITIDCGFNPRFIMIKQCTGQGDGWYVIDSARGINAGNDPWLRFNQAYQEITNTDIVDPTSGGFIVQAGGGSRVNDADGRKYLYWAIA